MSHVELTQIDKISHQIAELEAKKDLAVLEDEIVVKKADGTVTVEDKVALREARQNFRENHRTVADGQVEVETLNAPATQGEVG